ncbi:hypothetical protein PQC06_gp145 [Aeromonas phage LAh10]|uniref:Uncharacterized protein n=1 Tax=Aeromonas phage LAh10 TaxID=2591025 RepID=A0A514A175_9CAUD|nr:hypothetical protein PQC06_gp145 [Aeromonas phage LAh10]QDH47024.1 hypothetical protein LAh10_145 [Aeromonas phage LAh10]
MANKVSTQDKNLVTRSFRLLSDGVANPTDEYINTDYDLYTSFFSTAIGDNKYINPLPGYGFNTDPYPEPIMENRYGNMGRFYKRIHHDNAEMVTLTACVPEFTGILPFLMNMFDYSAAVMVNKGRAPGWAFYIGQAAGAIAFFPAQIVAASWNFFEYLTQQPKNQWYYGKAAMGQFLTAAQGMFNDLMVAAGYTLTVLPQGSQVMDTKLGDRQSNGLKGYRTHSDQAKSNYSYLNSMFPDAINQDGTVDITRVALRGVRKYRYFLNKVKSLDEGSRFRSVGEKDLAIERILNGLIKDGNFMNGSVGPAGKIGTYEVLTKELGSVGASRGSDEISYPEVASAYTNPSAYAEILPADMDTGQASGFDSVRAKVEGQVSAEREERFGINQGNSGAADGATSPQLQGTEAFFNDTNNLSEDSWLTQVGSLLMDHLYGGTDGITFRTEGTGAVSDSFSNASQQSAIASSFNNTVQAVQDFKFNMGGGVTGIEFIDKAMEIVKDSVTGLMAGSVVGNLPLALLGNSRVIIPEHWQDSTTSLHSETINLYFQAPYAHPYSIATNVFLPVALIMPFFVPFSTGGAMYGSPFMVKSFARGKGIIRSGMVRNASMTWGEGPLGWTTDKKPLNCRITLDLVDFDPILSVPVTRVTNPLDLVNIAKQSSRYLGDIGKYNDWVNRVAGLDYIDTVLRYNDMNRRLTRFTNDVETMFSPANVANIVNDSIIGDVSRLFVGRPMNR